MNVRKTLKQMEMYDLMWNAKANWMLRMESDRFIMVVHKNTNEYVNLYDTEFSKDSLELLSSMLDKHPNYI